MYPSTPSTQRVFQPIPADVERLGKIALNAAFKVHTTLGPGLLESVYQVAMKHVIEKSGVAVKTDVKLPIMFEGIKLDSGLHLDMLVEKCVIVEIFSVEKMNPLYQKQLLTYLRLSRLRLGFQINFNVPYLKDGIKRFVV
jgi:GxxExxY protein